MFYEDNGGTVCAVAGEDYAVLVADMRLSTGYRIHCRESSKCHKLTDSCMIASAGMNADATMLHHILDARIKAYAYANNGKVPAPKCIAQLLSTILYSRRFRPFYTFNVLCGVGTSGAGEVYTYDAIGSFEESGYTALGSGGHLLAPILDNQIARKNQKEGMQTPKRTKLEVIDLLKDAICSATERDIFTGDQAEIFVIDSGGVSENRLDLRKD